MKKTLICPKCEGRVLWRIDTLKLPVQDQSSFRNALSVSPVPLPVQVDAKWSGFATTGGFEAFICKGCGYTELYAYGIDDLLPDDNLGIQLIDNQPRGGLR
jgi:predicted nucleic-acid-binding Zn-ribbon protein